MHGASIPHNAVARLTTEFVKQSFIGDVNEPQTHSKHGARSKHNHMAAVPRVLKHVYHLLQFQSMKLSILAAAFAHLTWYQHSASEHFANRRDAESRHQELPTSTICRTPGGDKRYCVSDAWPPVAMMFSITVPPRSS